MPGRLAAALSSYTEPMPSKPRSAEYFDGWYADRVATPTVDEIMNRHMGFRPGTRAGTVPAEAIPELAEALRLTSGSTLLDLACGRGAYGLLIAQKAGASLIGVDFSAQALTQAREQAARMAVSTASFRVARLTADGTVRRQRRGRALYRRHPVPGRARRRLRRDPQGPQAWRPGGFDLLGTAGPQ